ncbi:MAG: hypothetical protein DRI69_05280 [Bacteroidetes bacterium]|nr:MAG: hypothetical protein DRI69_05280 [Bacteroidota bacterium]
MSGDQAENAILKPLEYHVIKPKLKLTQLNIMKNPLYNALMAMVMLFISITASEAQHYWVGGSGDWSDFANHWATTSGGNTFHGSAPTMTDDVIFDASSFTVTGQTVTMDAAQGECLSMTWAGVQFNPSFVSDAPEVINIYGSITLSPDMTCNLRFIELESDVAGNIITTSGTSFGSNSIFRLRGDGEWGLADVLNVSDVQIESGTFNSNGNTINCGFSFITFSDKMKTVNLGFSVLNIRQWRTRGSNNTFNTANSTLNTQSFYGDEDGTGPYVYGNLVIDDGGLIHGTSSFTSITLVADTFPQSIRLESGITLTCQQLLVSGTRQAPLEIYAQTEGEHATFIQANGTVDGTNLILKDVHASGGAVFNADQSEDLGNNTGWNITSVTIQDYYWVGNSGNWTDTGHWAKTSGGDMKYDVAPSRYDNVFFDENSVSDDNTTITVDDDASVRDLICTGVTNTPLLSAAYGNQLDIYGTVDFTDQIELNINSLRFQGRKTGNTIYLSALGSVSNIAFWGKGDWTLMSDIACSTFSVLDGTVSTNDKTVSCGFAFKQGNFNDVTLYLGASEIITRDFIIQDPKTVFDAGTSHIHASGIFNGNGYDFDKVTLSGNPTVNDQNTFNTLIIEPGTTASFEADSTQTIVQSLILDGTPDGLISLSSSENGTQATLSLNSGTVDGIYLILKDMNAIGGATFNATQSIDNGNNTGWNITEIVPIDFYWVGGTGDWSDSDNHWAKTSGGNDFYAFAPGLLDDVFFDENSFSEEGQSVTIDLGIINFNNMTWENATHNPSFTGLDKFVNIFGSLTFIDAMMVDITHYAFLTEEDVTLDFGSPSNPGNNSFLTFNGGGTWTLQDSMSTREFAMASGTFNTDGHGMHVDFRTVFDGTSDKVLNLGSSNFYTRSLSWNGLLGDNLTINGQNSSITVTSTFQPDPGIPNHASVLNLNDLRFLNNGLDQGLIFGEITLNTLTFDAGTKIKLTAGIPIHVNQLIAQGTENEVITIFSSADGVQAIISQTSGVVDGDYLDLKDLSGTGGAEFNAFNSINNGNISGWTFFGQTQTIDFPEINDLSETAGAFEITATASSGLDVEFEIIAGPATLNGNTVTLTGAGEVRIKASQDGNINFNPAPSVINAFCSTPLKPTIMLDDIDTTLLISSRADGNQWFLDGALIPGATDQTLSVPQSGTYTVQIIFGNCTSELSEPIVLFITSVSKWLHDDAIRIWPNPASDMIFLQVVDAHPDMEYTIFDMHGRTFLNGSLNLSADAKIGIDISRLVQGVYFLYGISESGQFRVRFVKSE